MNIEQERDKFKKACGDRFPTAFAKGFNYQKDRFNDSNLDRRFKGWLMHVRYLEAHRNE